MPIDYMSLANNMQRNRALEMQQSELQSLNAQRQQQMDHLAQMNPLAIAAQQEANRHAMELNPLTALYAKAQGERERQNIDFEAAQEQTRIDQLPYNERILAAEATAAELTPDQIQASIDASGASVRASDASARASDQRASTSRAARQAAQSEAQQAKQIKTAVTLGQYADQAGQFPEGSPERADFIESLIPQLTKMGMDPAELKKAAQDGVSDQELMNIKATAQGLTQQKPVSISDRVKLEKLAMDKEESARKIEESKRLDTAEAKNAFAAADSAIASIDKLLEFDKDVMEDVTGPIEGRMPTIQRDETDFVIGLEGLQSQLTMANIEKMAGVLSDSDLKVLREASGNLDRKQSSKRMRATLESIRDVMQRNKQVFAEKYGVKEENKNFDSVMSKYGI